MTDARRIVELDKRHVWHPYTPMQRYVEETEPLVVVRAEGSRFWDASGQSYLDANSSWWCAVLGHGHPRLVAALRDQAERLCHVPLAGIAHEQAALLAAELVEIVPAGLEHVFYSDDGSTAVETALKLALQYGAQIGRPRRRRFVALDGAFHGETLGASLVSGVEVFRRAFAGATLDCLRVPSDRKGHERAFSALGDLVDGYEAEIAGVVVEPMIQGAVGMRTYDAELLQRAREVTRRHGIPLIFDEVFSGYGRTGPMWASEHAGVEPDLLCIAKGFTAGMLPMAATLATHEIYAAFLGDPSRAFFHGHTFCGNPLGARVAREVLAVYRDDRVLEAARPKAEILRSAFQLLGELPGVENARSLGMVGALELAGGDGYLAESGWRVYDQALRRGAYLRPLGNTVYVAPALNIPDGDLDELLGIVGESVRAVLST
ncbi:MAG TPA: adenosylmethionine--8-amino-7-oxononanoate transaminase [Polyangiaceae bacterium]|nr:adenosylmethionine--8-amino-7-oxononanoate transaminase [Polyangiaceae bacterium]